MKKWLDDFKERIGYSDKFKEMETSRAVRVKDLNTLITLAELHLIKKELFEIDKKLFNERGAKILELTEFLQDRSGRIGDNPVDIAMDYIEALEEKQMSLIQAIESNNAMIKTATKVIESVLE